MILYDQYKINEFGSAFFSLENESEINIPINSLINLYNNSNEISIKRNELSNNNIFKSNDSLRIILRFLKMIIKMKILYQMKNLILILI